MSSNTNLCWPLFLIFAFIFDGFVYSSYLVARSWLGISLLFESLNIYQYSILCKKEPRIIINTILSKTRLTDEDIEIKWNRKYHIGDLPVAFQIMSPILVAKSKRMTIHKTALTQRFLLLISAVFLSAFFTSCFIYLF